MGVKVLPPDGAWIISINRLSLSEVTQPGISLLSDTRRVVAAVNDGTNQNRSLKKFSAQQRCAGSHFRFSATI